MTLKSSIRTQSRKKGGLIISELRERIKNLRKMAQELEKERLRALNG